MSGLTLDDNTVKREGKEMRLIFHTRPVRYLLLRNWWGFRKGAMWTYKMNGRAYLLDMGCLTIGVSIV